VKSGIGSAAKVDSAMTDDAARGDRAATTPTTSSIAM
jgi:hypothetical protein